MTRSLAHRECPAIGDEGSGAPELWLGVYLLAIEVESGGASLVVWKRCPMRAAGSG